MLPKIENVVRYSYRTAEPEKFLFAVPRDFVSSLEDELCKISGFGKDNHVTFSFSYENSGFYPMVIYPKNSYTNYINPKNISVLFHDGMAIFGEGVKIGNW